MNKYHLTKITFLTGHAVFKPQTYKLIREPGGMGRLESEFMTLVGEYDQLLAGCAAAGIRISSFEDRSQITLPPHSHSFWASLKETLLDMLFGPNQREAIRKEREARDRAEATAQRHAKAARDLAAEGHAKG